MDPAVLFERDSDVARLLRVVDSARSRTGRLAVLEGEPGSGKSSLAKAIAESARRDDVRVLYVTIEPGDTPLAPLIELVTTASGSNAGALGSLVTDRPLVVIVEDLQWADDTTLATLRALARRIRDVGCGLVVTARLGPRTSAVSHCLEVLTAEGADWVRLAPLSDQAISRLVAHDAGGPPGPRLRTRLAGAAGNPLLVREFVRSARAVDALVDSGGQIDLDDSAGELRIDLPTGVVARLTTLSEGVSELLHAAAVVGPCGADWLGPILECPPARVRRAVCDATAAGFLDPTSPLVQFRHQLLADAFRARVSPASQAAIHRQLGRRLAAEGAPAALVARHLELGSPTLDAEAVCWLRRAAEDAALVDPRSAAELLGRALSAMAADDPDRGDALLKRARVLIGQGRLTEARACAAEALASPTDTPTRASLRALVGEAKLLAGRPGEAVGEIEHALADGPVDHRQHARLRAQAAQSRLWAYDLRGATREAKAALQIADRAADPVAASHALSVASRVAAFQLDLDRAVRAGEQAVERAADAPAAVRGAPHLYLGLALANSDQWDRARRVLEEGRARCDALGTAWALPRYEGALATLSFFTGAWNDAVVAGEASRLISDDTGCRAEQAQIDAIVGLIAHHRGDRAAATEAAHRAAAATTAPGADGSGVPYLCWLNALRAEACGDLARGVARLRLACSLAFELDVPLVTLFLAPDLARLALADGQHDTAEWIATEVSRVAPRAATITADATSGFCRSIIARDVDGLLAAADGFERAGRPLFAARAFDTAGRAARAAARAVVAVDALRRAIALYDELGAALDGRAARRQLRALGARTGARGARRRPVTGWDSLTPTEQTVACLVAEGLANGEIADRLYVSKRTVETHISRLYAKLQVDTRVAIANIGRDATEPVPA